MWSELIHRKLHCINTWKSAEVRAYICLIGVVKFFPGFAANAVVWNREIFALFVISAVSYFPIRDSFKVKPTLEAMKKGIEAYTDSIRAVTCGCMPNLPKDDSLSKCIHCCGILLIEPPDDWPYEYKALPRSQALSVKWQTLKRLQTGRTLRTQNAQQGWYLYENHIPKT